MWYKSNPMLSCKNNTAIIIAYKGGTSASAGVIKYTPEGEAYIHFEGVDWIKEDWETNHSWALSPYNSPDENDLIKEDEMMTTGETVNRVVTVGDLKKLLGDDDSMPVFLYDCHEEHTQFKSVYEENLTFIKTGLTTYATTPEGAKDDLEYNCDYEIIDSKLCKIISV